MLIMSFRVSLLLSLINTTLQAELSMLTEARTPPPVTPVWIRPWAQHIPSAQIQQME